MAGLTHEGEVRAMVSRFLAWRLPPDFRPDGGVSFEPEYATVGGGTARREPSGTNLLDARQAEAMVRHLLGLTLEQEADDRRARAGAELLEMIAEEAAEVVQACTKALRHGLGSRHPDGGPTNAQQLARELRDLSCVVAVAHFSGVLDGYLTDEVAETLRRKWRYTHHQVGEEQQAAWQAAEDWLGTLSQPAVEEDWLGTLSQPAVEEDWMAREGRLAQYGDLDGGLPQSEDHSRRGFEPR